MKPLTLAATLPAAGLMLMGTAAPLAPGDLTVSIGIPRISSASYHRPYVAVWIERPDQTAVRTLSVWYDTALPAGEGKDWLKDIRTWWRKNGRNLTLPADGVSGPTRAPGTQTVTVPASRLRYLPAGNYVLAVEAARDAHLACKAAANMRGVPVLALHRDLFRNPLQPEEAGRFGAILLDPPRAGARDQVAQIAASDAARVAYVSCNPASWARDARTLVEAGFRLEKLRPVGQFRWSTHVELSSYFTR